MAFSLRVKINQNEIEITGTQKEVLKTIEDLPKLIESIAKVFSQQNPQNPQTPQTPTTEKAPLKVRLTPPAAPAPSKMYPSIKKAKNCSQAVLKLLETEWGAWRPRTLPEIVEALKANALHYPSSTLSGVLAWLVKKGKVRRWKTDAGYVYILVEKESA